MVSIILFIFEYNWEENMLSILYKDNRWPISVIKKNELFISKI